MSKFALISFYMYVLKELLSSASYIVDWMDYCWSKQLFLCYLIFLKMMLFLLKTWTLVEVSQRSQMKMFGDTTFQCFIEARRIIIVKNTLTCTFLSLSILKLGSYKHGFGAFWCTHTQLSTIILEQSNTCWAKL